MKFGLFYIIFVNTAQKHFVFRSQKQNFITSDVIAGNVIYLIYY